jgi:hypothetical protein
MTYVRLNTIGPDCWLHVDLGAGRPTARVNIISTDEGIVVDVWRDGDDEAAPVASTYAFDEDLEDTV